jgi:putative pyruvate formate lyase activating enzyme
VFFSGCALRCEFCQNAKISLSGFGETVTVERLREIYAELTALGAENINLVTASHFTEAVAESLGPGPEIPVVWNSSGYESVETLRLLSGRVNVYMPDFKYALTKPAADYSNAPDYPRAAEDAILEMHRQVGDCKISPDGVLESGLLVRHLVLPGNLENTFRVIDRFAELFAPGEALFSLMTQYTPVRESRFPELNRKLSRAEYEAAVAYLEDSGIGDGYYQDEPDGSEADWIPDFDLTGVP